MTTIGNKVKDAGAKSLSETLKSNTAVTRLYLESLKKTRKEIHQQTTHFTIIIPSENKIGKAGAASLCEALKFNTTLTELTVKCKHKGRHEKDVRLQFTLFFIHRGVNGNSQES